MKTTTKNYGHGDINYKIINDTAYHEETPKEVVNILENVLNSRRDQRIRVFYGDAKTGKDWNEEHDVIGYLGRSTGSLKIPLLINNKNSHGGGSILDHCIVKITIDKRIIYKHLNYNNGEFAVKLCNDTELLKKGYTHQVFKNGENIANFKNEKLANNYISFLEGKRNKI